MCQGCPQVEDFPALFTHPTARGKHEALWGLLMHGTKKYLVRAYYWSPSGILSLCKLGLPTLGIDPLLVCYARHPFPSVCFLIGRIRKILQVNVLDEK